MNSQYFIRGIGGTLTTFLLILIASFFLSATSMSFANSAMVSYKPIFINQINGLLSPLNLFIFSSILQIKNYSIWLFGKIKEISIKEFESKEGKEWRIKKKVSD